MNVEFLIHGVLSSGQALSAQKDSDYYKQFYSEQQASVLMTVEIVNRPHGISTYYNYLRNNNIVSSREGSYFGITVRIDDAFCSDVKGMYMILDNLFNKMIVGHTLKQNNGRYEYAIDSFTSENEKNYISRIEAQFSSMFSSFFSNNDFVSISQNNASAGKVFSVNPSDLTSQIALDAFSKKIKLYVSPTYASSQTIAAKKDADAKIQAANDAKCKVESEANAKVRAAQETGSKAAADANAKALAAEDARNAFERTTKQEILQARDEIKSLKIKIQELASKNNKLSEELKRCGKDQEIISAVADIKKPIAALAALLSTRFQDNNENDTERNGQNKTPTKKDKKKRGLGYRFLMEYWALLFLLSFCSMVWIMTKVLILVF